jgi:peptide/nickel transport system ATP-binding protein
MELLRVNDLSVTYRRGPSRVKALDRVALTLVEGETLGIVGESGCGKSTLAFALARLLPRAADVSGDVLLDGDNLVGMGPEELSRVRWTKIAMIFQAAMNALNPVMTVRRQIIEPMLYHRTETDVESASRRAEELFELVGLPISRLDSYPHELSGGMRQRAVMAMSLACRPKLLIADEPTTALDVVIQDQIFLRLNAAKAALGLSLILVSHDIGLVAENCDRVAVMYGGRIVEVGSAREVLNRPRHPYSAILSRATPSLSSNQELVSLPGSAPDLSRPIVACIFEHRCPMSQDICRVADPSFHSFETGHISRCHFAEAVDPAETLKGLHRFERPPGAVITAPAIVARNLSKSFSLKAGLREILTGQRKRLIAVNDVSLEIGRGEAIGVVGESGCGKTTLAMLLAGLERPTSGTIEVSGTSLASLATQQEKAFRRAVQVIFQDPYEALNPRMRIADIVGEPLLIHNIGLDKEDRYRKVLAMLKRVGLLPAEDFALRFPRELSGGQRQRIAIARAMIVEPRVVIADEPLSMLDASVKAGIMALLADFKRDGVSILVITHDLAITKYLCDRIAVMYLGDLVEIGPSDLIVATPRHPYTQRLLDSVPDAGGERSRGVLTDAEPPNAAARPTGCPFHPRCPLATEMCIRERPPLAVIDERLSACWNAELMRDPSKRTAFHASVNYAS